MENIHPIFDRVLARSDYESLLKQKSGVFWLTGLSGSGKSTLAQAVEKALHQQGRMVKILDGDNIRTGLCNNLSFSAEDRIENIRRIAEVSKLFLNTGIICICSFVSPTREIRAMAADIVGNEDFHEIFVNASLEACEARDVKGLYKKARAGEIKNFTGIDAPFEAPEAPFLEVRTDQDDIESCKQQILDGLLPKIAYSDKVVDKV